jgi:hypothetical protein
MDPVSPQKRPIGVTVGPLAFLFAITFGLLTFAVLNAFDGFQDGEPTPTPLGPIMLDGEYAKLGLSFIAFMVPILLSGMRNSFGSPRPKSTSTVWTAAAPALMRPKVGGVTRDEFDALSARVRELEPKPTVEQVHAAVDAAFSAPPTQPAAPQVAVVAVPIPAPQAPAVAPAV